MQQSFTFPEPDEAERWLPVVGYEGLYAVSDLGRVRSFYAGRGKGKRGGLLRPGMSSGRLMVVLYRDRIGKSRLVHHLVLEAFVGPRPPGWDACHGPGRELDNRLVNLSWGTRAKNNGPDRIRDGTDSRGERHAMAKLTNAEVRECRARRAAGERTGVLAREFGLSQSAMSQAISGRNYGVVGPTTPLSRAEQNASRASHGEAHGSAKLTAEIVMECRIRFAAGETHRSLAREFGVSQATMWKAASGRMWRHLPMPPAA